MLPPLLTCIFCVATSSGTGKAAAGHELLKSLTSALISTGVATIAYLNANLQIPRDRCANGSWPRHSSESKVWIETLELRLVDDNIQGMGSLIPILHSSALVLYVKSKAEYDA